MATQEGFGFKVVNTSTKNLPVGRQTVSFMRSALLNGSPATTDYSFASKTGQVIYTGPAVKDTAIIAFDDAQAALDFAANKPGRAVYRLHYFARLVIPVTKVLKLNLGWHRNALAFWQAVEAGSDLKAFNTRSAPEHSIGIFGVVTLQDRLYTIADAAPKAVPAMVPAPAEGVYPPADEADAVLDPAG